MLDARAIKTKDEATDHLLSYHKATQDRGLRLKQMKSDNGGEFIGQDYKNACRQNAILPTTGAPETPQS